MIWVMEIDLKDCTVEGNILTYIMTDAFIQFFLNHKHKLFKGYPEFLNVKGNKMLRFDRVGLTGAYHLYRTGNFDLHIKYN